VKVPYKVLSASALSALVAVPALATPAFAQDTAPTIGEYNFETLESISVEDLNTIEAIGSTHPAYDTYFDENGYLIETPTTIEINDQTVDYVELNASLAITGAADVEEYLDEGNELPVVSTETNIEEVKAITPTTVEVTFNEPVESVNNVDIVDDEGNEAFVDTVELSEDGLSATVNLHDTLQDQTRYNVLAQTSAGDFTDDFPYAVGEIDEIVASDDTFNPDEQPYAIDYSVVTTTGLDITDQTDVEFSSTVPNAINDNGEVIGLEDGESIFVSISAGDVESGVFQVTANSGEADEYVDFTVGENNWGDEDFEPTKHVTVDNESAAISVLFHDQYGEPVIMNGSDEEVTFESEDLSKLIIDEATGELIPRETGEVDVRITTDSGISQIVTVNIVDEAELEGFTFEEGGDTLEGPVQINPAATPGDQDTDATVEVQPINQYGDNYTFEAGENSQLTVSVDGESVEVTNDDADGNSDNGLQIDAGESISLSATEESGTATVTVENTDGTVSSSFDVEIVKSGEIDGYAIDASTTELDLYQENEDGTEDTTPAQASFSVSPVDENGVATDVAQEADWKVYNEDGDLVTNNLGEEVTTTEQLTVGESVSGDEADVELEEGTYTIQATIGDLVVAEQSLEVTDSEADYEVSQNTDEITVNNNQSLFEAIANGLEVTQGDNEIDSENIQSIEVISDNSQVISYDGSSFTLDSGNATDVYGELGDATLTVTGITLEDETETSFDDLYFDVTVTEGTSEASAATQDEVTQAIENAPENGVLNLNLEGATKDITIDTEKALDINIIGDLGSQNLTVNAPNATVNNTATTDGTIDIQDVSGNTWNENADGNTLTFNDTDEDSNLVISGNPSAVAVNTTAPVQIEENASVGTLTVTDEVSSEVNVTNNGSIEFLEGANAEDIGGEGAVAAPSVTIEAFETVSEGTKEITVSGTTTAIEGGEQLDLAVEEADEVVRSTTAEVTDGSYENTIELNDPITAGEYEVTVSYDEQQLNSIPFSVAEQVVYSANGEITNINAGEAEVTYEEGTFAVPAYVTEFTFTDGGVEVTATQTDEEGTFETDAAEIEDPGSITDGSEIYSNTYEGDYVENATEGYSVDVHLDNADFANATSVTVTLLDEEENTIQTNTLLENADVSGQSLTSPFYSGFNYDEDEYWSTSEKTMSESQTATSADITVELENGATLNKTVEIPAQ